MKKEIQKIYSREKNDTAANVMLNIIDILGLLITIAFLFIGIHYRNMFWVCMMFPVLLIFMFVGNITEKLKELNDTLNAVFIAEIDLLNEYGFSSGEELYYISNSGILHENVIGEAFQTKRSPYTYVRKRGPIKENREKALALPKSQEFQQKLIYAINNNESKCEGWDICPISRVEKSFRSILGKGYVIADKQGARKKIYISNKIQDKDSLIKKIDTLIKK